MKNENKRALNSYITIVILILIAIVIFALKVNAQEKKIGYLVCVSDLQYIECQKIDDLQDVQRIANHLFEGVTIDVEKQLRLSNYIQISTEYHILYIEKKRIVYTKKGKVKYKNIKRKHLK